MENAKCKRRELAKNKNYARKGGRKPQKRTKKTKEKQNLQPLMRTRHKYDGRRVDGMFLRGLRTQGITKGSPSEVKQVWKNEDINKIIDIGKVFFQKGKLAIHPRRRRKGGSGCRDSRKLGKSCFASGGSPTDSSQDFECSLSPKSPPLTHAEVIRMKERSANEKPVGRRKLNLEEELHNFSLKYEAVVGAQILCKLPQNGVLEDALMALRKLQKTSRDGRYMLASPFPAKFDAPILTFMNKKDPEREEPPLLASQVEFLRDDLEADDFAFRGNFLVPEEQFCESFVETPLENMFVMHTPTVGSGDHLSYLSVFDGNEGESAIVESQTKDFQKPVKELRIVTPPIQFYRRNMF